LVRRYCRRDEEKDDDDADDVEVDKEGIIFSSMFYFFQKSTQGSAIDGEAQLRRVGVLLMMGQGKKSR
jgi:hypothetical protein